MYLHPMALLSLATFIFAYSIRKSRLVRILKTHSLHSIRARKSQKVAFVRDVAFEQYRTLHTVKIEVNRCIRVNVHTGIFIVYRYFYGILAFLRYVCWFASIKLFTGYRYRYDKNTFFYCGISPSSSP